ncbi:MAG TPA: alpha/beta fold hydrolase [Acidimicrobiales bacterium]
MTNSPPQEQVREHVSVHGIHVVVDRRGTGERVVVVHGEDGALFLDPFLDALAAEQREVCLLHLPGWGVSEPNRSIEGVDDLALLLLDYLEMEHAPAAQVVAISFGAWVAAHAAVLASHRFAKLALVAPVGIKTAGREERSFVDIWATSSDELRASLYGDVSRAPDLRLLDDDAFLRLAYANEAVARHAWEPYLHDPKLARRLYRITTPTLVITGKADRFVLEPDYGQRWVERLGGPARAVELDGVGHRIEEESPNELASLIGDFLAGT